METRERRRIGSACRWLPLAVALATAPAMAMPGQPFEQELARLANMSLEELMNTEVISVAGKPRPRMATPAALTVITAEDIRRSGHRTLV